MLKLKIILLFLFITNEVFANKKKPSKLLLKIHEEGKEEELFKTKMQNEKKEALMKKIRDAKGGFFIGKIKSRIFEHKVEYINNLHKYNFNKEIQTKIII